MAQRTRDGSAREPEPATKQPGDVRHCRVCDVRLSTYNPNPYCWQHMIGHPWRGPTAKPKY